MPFYTAKCQSCDMTTPYFKSRIADRHDTPECCGAPTLKLLDTPQIGALSFSGSAGFVADAKADKQWIETGSDLKRYMKDNDFVTPGEGEERAKDARVKREHETDKALDAAIDKAMQQHY